MAPQPLGRVRQSFVVLGTATGMVFGFSAAYLSTLSVFLKPIGSSFGWTRSEVSLVAVMAQVGLAIGSPVLGRLLGRFGARRLIPLSVVLFGAGLLALGQASSLATFGLCSLLLGAAAAGTTPAGYLTILPAVFDRRLGRSMGLAMFGLGMGNTVLPLVANYLVSDLGWRHAYAVLGMIVIAGGLLGLFLVFGAGLGLGGPRAVVIGIDEAEAAGDELAPALRCGAFWLVGSILFATSAVVIGAIVHIVPALTDGGMSPADAARVAALIGIGVIAGRVGTGFLLDTAEARYVAAVAFAIGGAGLAVTAATIGSGSGRVVPVGAFMFALAIGVEGDFIPFFVRRYFGKRRFSQLYGILFSFFAAGGAVGPVAFGWVFDWSGTYVAAFWIGGGVCLWSAAAVATLGPYRFGINGT